ncbi:MAG: hypothetical protein RQ758_00705 [Methanomicrobiaceae archaeon]|nr:hypothetical protein [Methanomicrobiaceae archaeon]
MTLETMESVGSITEALMQTAYQIIAFLPLLIAAIIILIIGWVAGRFLGSIVSKILDKIGVDDAIRKTSVGKAIEESGTEIVHLFDLIIRWFVYLIAILAAANVLQLALLSDLLQSIVLYLPNVAVFLIILVAGFILVDYFADILHAWGKGRDIAFLGMIITILRFFFYFIILVLALSQLLIDLTIIYIFIEPVAWGVGIGVGAGIAAFLAFGLKDRAPEMLDNMIGKLK